jgi:hypothetical protein
MAFPCPTNLLHLNRYSPFAIYADHIKLTTHVNPLRVKVHMLYKLLYIFKIRIAHTDLYPLNPNDALNKKPRDLSIELSIQAP